MEEYKKRDTNKISVYTASAGSGKTYTLTQEYLCLAMGGKEGSWQNFQAASVLAITFTNAATADMKRKIMEALWDLSQGRYADAKKLSKILQLSLDEIQRRSFAVLKYLLHQYERFAIQTIDSFVQRVIRPFAFELGLPRSYETDIDTKAWVEKIKDFLLSDYACQGKETLTEIINGFMEGQAEDKQKGKMNIEESLGKILTMAFEEQNIPYLQMLQKWTEADFIEQIKQYRKFKSDIERQVSCICEPLREIALKESLSFSDFCIGKNSPIAILSLGNFKNKKSLTEFVQSKYRSKNWDKALENGVFKTPKLHVNWFGKWQQACEALGSLEWTAYELVEALEPHLYTLSLMNRAENYKRQWQESEGRVPISEFNQKIHALLQDTDVPYLYERVGSVFHHILVDEFQDTSALQWENLRPLIQNNRASGYWNMVVGDPKQSIYRFRAACMEQMLELQKKTGEVENIHLSSNWRSHPGIVAFNNLFYQFLKNEYTPDKDRVEFSEWQEMLPKFRESYCQHEQYYRSETSAYPSEDPSRVRICFYDEAEGREESFEDWNCRKILDILERHKPSDVAVLCAQNKYVDLVSHFLVSKGFKVSTDDSLSVKMSLEVRTLVLALRYMNVPYSQDYRLRLRWQWNRMKVEQEMQNLRFLYLDQLRISGRTLYDKALQLLKNWHISPSLDQYLLTFLDELQSCCFSGEEAFLRFWDEEDRQIRCKVQPLAKESTALEHEEESVRICTVHKAKGLEYPVVIEAFAVDSPRKEHESTLWVRLGTEGSICGKELPVSLMTLSDAKRLDRTAVEARAERERMILDRINVLYVMTTRAKDYLYVLTREMSRHVAYSEALYWKAFTEKYPAYVEREDKIRDEKLGELCVATSLVKENVVCVESKPFLVWDWQDHFEPVWSVSEKVGKEELEWGNFLHRLMSLLEYRVEKEVLSQKIEMMMEKQSSLLLHTKEEILHLICQMWDHPLLAPAFEKEGAKVYMEREICFQGKIYRPDRVVETFCATYLIDYKTGEAREEHQEQLIKYAMLLHQMGYKEIRPYIVYMGGQEVEVKALEG